MGKREDIVSEIRDKIEDYENNMSTWLSRSNEWAELFTIERPKRKANAYSNPRLTLFHSSVETIATTTYRMLTSQDPFFSIIPMDYDVPDENFYLIQKVLEVQLRVSEYKKNLLKALRSVLVFGTVIVEEPFEIVQLNPFGRKIPVTKFKPRSLIQMGFDRGCTDINDSDWVYTTDIVSKNKLLAMANNDAFKDSWSKADINAAIEDNDSTVTSWLSARLSKANYNISQTKESSFSELVIYQGQLDTLKDGAHYICGLVNRKHLVKFKANPDQSGRRNFRVAKWIDWEVEPLGLGLGRLLAANHRSLDANRQKMEDLMSFGTYNIWLKDNLAGINSADLVIRPNKIIGADNINGLKRLDVDTAGVLNGLKLEEIKTAEFKTASGATDTLMASVTEATASEVSLAQNEAIRRLSVYGEICAEELVRAHIERMHNNNRLNISEPFMIGTDHGPKRIYPVDLNADVDIEIKVTTDKDFRPKRTEGMVQWLQIATSIRNETGKRLNTLPIHKEIARAYGINPDQVILEDVPVQQPGAPVGGGELPPGMEDLAAQGIVQTPIGQVAGSVNQMEAI